MKAACCQPRRLFGGLVVVMVVCFALTPILSAQGVDPGPRPPGTSPSLPSVCPIVLSLPLKFNPPTCFDIDQPPSNPAQPPATGAGNIIAGSGNLGGFWFQAVSVFSATATVTPPSGATTITGLGPSFNALSCLGCHSEPTVGGASPGFVTVNGNLERTTVIPGIPFTSVLQNPEFIAAGADGATNTLPCFIVSPSSASTGCGIPLGDFPTENFSDGPVVEVRFPMGFISSATPNVDPVMKGAVADLFTFTGRSDENAPGCTIGQEPITAQNLAGNAIFRTPTPTFGLGFVENTPELTLLANLAANGAAKASFHIAGTFNRSGNDQTITRFGWKAQNKSLMIFAGEASNVEMGVTNELFPNERTTGSGSNCTPNPQPEDEILLTTTSPGDASQISSVVQNNAVFMRLNGAPSQCDYTSTVNGSGAPVCLPLTPGGNALKGQCFFGTSISTTATNCAAITGGRPAYGIGCVLCHSDRLTTANSQQSGLANTTYAPYSDFAIHAMGSDGDGVTQGNAGPTQFRTAPLWGAGQRFFFLHDGRDINLDHAVRDHCPNGDTSATPNESCDVINQYKALPVADQTFILEFLRSL